MDSKSKLQGFHANIRKAHHDSFFEKKRIKLLEHLDKKQQMMEEQFTITNNPIDVSLADMVKAAKFSQQESGIRALKTADYQTILTKYLGEEHIGSEEQFYATYILCNLFFIKQTPPNEELTKKIINLLKDSEIRTIQNCLAMLENLLLDFPEWRDHVVKEYGLMIRLSHLFTAPQPTNKYLQTLLMVVYRTLYKAQPNESFKNIKKPVCQMIMNMNVQIQEFQLLKMAMKVMHSLCVSYPEDTGKFITLANIIPRLITIVLAFNDHNLKHITLEFIKASLGTMPTPVFIQKAIPYLRRLQEDRYDIVKTNSAFSANKMQNLAYSILNQALQIGKLSAETLFEDSLASSMLLTLQVTEQPDIIDLLVRIFSILLLNTSNPSAKAQINQVFTKIRAKCQDSYELMAYLHQIDGLQKHI